MATGMPIRESRSAIVDASGAGSANVVTSCSGAGPASSADGEFGALPLLALGAATPAAQWLRGKPVGLPALLPQRIRRRVRWAGLVVRREIAR